MIFPLSLLGICRIAPFSLLLSFPLPFFARDELDFTVDLYGVWRDRGQSFQTRGRYQLCALRVLKKGETVVALPRTRGPREGRKCPRGRRTAFLSSVEVHLGAQEGP